MYTGRDSPPCVYFCAGITRIALLSPRRTQCMSFVCGHWESSPGYTSEFAGAPVNKPTPVGGGIAKRASAQ